MAEENIEKKMEENKDTGSNHGNKNGKLLVVIRISGMVKVKRDVSGTLDRLKLRRKYACVLLNSGSKDLMGMLMKVKYHVAYGEIDEGVLEKLIIERAESKEGRKREIKIDGMEVAKGLMSGKKLSDFGLKNFFRLHPPRKGIDSKLQYPKGVLGNNKKINELVRRML